MNKTQITTKFYPEGDRYLFDGIAGNYQIDTWQDAWYFGMWINPKERSISTYAEGDFTKVTCLDTETLITRLLKMFQFHTGAVIDASFWESSEVYKSSWEEIFNHELFKKHLCLDRESDIIRQL